MSRYNRAPLLTRMVDRPSQDTVPLEVAREAEKRAKASCEHTWKVEPSDWDDLPEEVTGCATCQRCRKQVFAYRCGECGGNVPDSEACLKCGSS